MDHTIRAAHERVMPRRGRQTPNDSVGTTGTPIRPQGRHKAGPQSDQRRARTRGVKSIIEAEPAQSPLLPQPGVTPPQDPPLLRSPSRHSPAQADDSRGMRVIGTGTRGGQCHLRDATNILATSSLRDECTPAALGRRIAERTRVRSQSYGV
jgi:hypothetical protein